MMHVALVGNTQAQAARLKRFLTIDAEIILDDETRSTRNAPLEVDAAISIRFSEADIAAISCRLLQCSGAGIDGIALKALPKTITVCVVNEHEIPIAEYVMLGILEHEIGMATAAATFDKRRWGDLFRGRVTHGEAAGKTIGIVGFGHIGKAIATRARAFGMRVVAVNRSGAAHAEADRIQRFDRLPSLLAESDYVALACPLTEETRGMIGAAELAAMKPTALLINVARGPVADEGALYQALSSRRIAGALLDAWYNYPTLADPNPQPSRHDFAALDNVRATPHMSGWTEELLERRYRRIAENLARFSRGEALLNVVWRDGGPA
jgi:phosphoglycerate dehydrogenase-like enzyme